MISTTRTGLIAAAALLASLGIATAEPTSEGNAHKCWDNIAKQVREQSTRASQHAATGTEAGNVRGGSGGAASAGGGSPTAAAQGSDTGLPSAMNRPGTSPQSNASPPGRPREAEGLPDCNT